MKKLMVIGASVLQLPAIIRAKELGYEVAVADYNPEAIGIPYADKFYCVSTIDKEKVLEAATDFMPDGIMTLASDMPMRSVALVCEKLGISGISSETAIKATDKGEMIKAFKEHDVPSPWFYIAKDFTVFEKIKDSVTYPCIMKPVDNSGSRGVVLIESKEELERNFEYSISQSRGAGVIIEEYMTGPEVSVEIMIVDGKVNVLAITDKLTTGAPHFVEMGHSQQTRLDLKTQEQIKCVATKAVKSVGIYNGPAHVEIMVTKDGPKMIELGARMGGDCITTHLVPLSTGIDMVEATIKIACGLKPDLTQKFNKGSAIRYFNVPKGVIKEISGVEDAKKIEGVKEITFVKKVGETSGDINSSTDRVGFVIAQGENADGAIKICEQVLRKIKISVK